MLVNWGLQAFAYLAILDQAKNNNNNTSNNTNKKELIGGVHLDLLALTVLVQLGSALHSTKWFYLLAIVPLWGGWMLYSTFKGQFPNNNNAASSSAAGSGVSDDKRQKRAQKRAQKWS